MDFSRLLSQSLNDAGLSQAAFGRAVSMTGPFINMICRGKATPPLDRLDDWAELLGLKDEKRERFIQSGHLAHSPQFVRDLVQEQQSELAHLRQEVGHLASEVARLVDRDSKGGSDA